MFVFFFFFACWLAFWLSAVCFQLERESEPRYHGAYDNWMAMHAAPTAVCRLGLPVSLLLSLSFSASRLFYGLPFALPFALCPTDKWTAPVRLSRSQRRALGCRLRYAGGTEEREDGKSTTRTTSTECTTESRAGSRGSSNKGASSVDKWTAQVAGRRQQQQQHQAEPGNYAAR